MNHYGSIRFAQVPERVSTKKSAVLNIGHSKLNHLGAQGTFKPPPFLFGLQLRASLEAELSSARSQLSAGRTREETAAREMQKLRAESEAALAEKVCIYIYIHIHIHIYKSALAENVIK